MIRFLLAYLSIYCLAHYYVQRKIRTAFSPGRTAHLAILLFMAAMVAAPLMVRLTEKGGFETGARIVSYAGYSWMGLLFLFVILSGTIDLIRLPFLVTKALGYRQPARVWVSPRRLLTIEMLIVAAAYGYGLFEAADIRLEHVEITSPKIPEHPGRIRIVQISDVHLGLIIRGQRLSKIIARIESANPDILVSTGDLVDGQLNHLAKEAELLAALNPPLGKIAVTGNHEFYAGLQNALDFTEQAGFTILRHQDITAGTINLVGVDDRTLTSWGREPLKSERDLLLAQPRENFTVLLKHRPDIDPESLGHFDLQLSGHTHKGQIIPFNLLTWLAYPQQAGHLTPLESGFLYLSRGTGTWGPPIRLLAPPEITIIDLLHGP
jgi:predicted MPP superfamily phosphohydrolase